MKIKDLYGAGKVVISFEFFPPKTDEGELRLFEVVRELKELNPSFISVTYGAMGTTRANTLRIVAKIKKEIGIEAAAHLTCVAHTKDEIEKVLSDLQSAGIENIVALRGDPPKGETEFKPIPNGFKHASELVAFIRTHARFSRVFSIAVAGYPEGHIECSDKEQDLRNLKHKVEQGADAVVTQLFFDNQKYFDFERRAKKMGINVPIIAGIMPETQGPQIQKFAQMCGASIPKEMSDAIQKYGDDQVSIEAYGIEYATRQCKELIRAGIAGLHFYTLNKSKSTRQIYQNLFS